MTIDIRELRLVQRYVVEAAIQGSFGAATISVLDVCEHGVQMEHAQPLRIGTRSRLWFKQGEIAASTQAAVVWSHLSGKPNSEGKLLYRSGARIEEGSDSFVSALRVLASRGVLRHDSQSLDRKRKLLLDRESEKAGKATVKVIEKEPQVRPDQLLLIGHARERLEANPDEALRWFGRAKGALDESGAQVADSVRSRDLLLAVWMYLERSIDLGTLVYVFNRS